MDGWTSQDFQEVKEKVFGEEAEISLCLDTYVGVWRYVEGC